jgi:hypothetical protein
VKLAALFAPDSVFRIYAFSAFLTVVVLLAILIGLGPTALFLALVLVGLEVTFSFDNAVVNAKILQRMPPFWQKMFLTVGILVAVFGMRLVLPIVLVAITASLDFASVVGLALNDPDVYAAHLQEAHPVISAFGGMFLLMLFLDFMLDKSRKIHWIALIEKSFKRIGQLNQVSVIIALLTIMLVTQAAGGEQKFIVITAGIAGMITYLIIHALTGFFEKKHESRTQQAVSAASLAQAGLFNFIYLEVLDASFSFDGVIGAFAITNQVAIIAAGLGIGAIWVRSMTVHLAKKHVLAKYRYLDHGAHYAIGVLAGILLVGIAHETSEVVTGTIGIAIIIAAFGSSIVYNRRQAMASQNVSESSTTDG